jgi:threonine dehydrogenase-like Zn-dependent dehydrogenase
MTTTPRHVVFGTGAIGLATVDALRRRQVLHIRHYGRHPQSDVTLQRPTP